MNRALALLMLLAALLPAAAAKRKTPALDQKLQPLQLRQDFKILRQALEQIHPGLHLYTPKENLDALFNHTAKSLDQPMTLREFYLRVAPVVEKAKCGHTYFDIPRRTLNQLQGGEPLFPLPLFFIGPRAFVDTASGALPLGAEITAIGGVPMKKLVARCLPFIRSDGFNITMKHRMLADEFALHLRLLDGKKDAFEVEHLPPGGKEKKTATLDAIPGRKLAARHSAAEMRRNYGFRMLDETTGLLTANSFDFGHRRKGRVKYRKFLKDSFAELKTKGAKHLIVDMRFNEGGYAGYESRLFSYLAQKPFREARSAIALTLDIPLEEHLDKRGFFRGVERAIERDLEKEFVKDANGTYRIIDEKNQLHKPRPNRFTGRVYLLTSGWTHSGGAVLCSLALANDNVTFIGQETGGGHEFYTAGNMVLYRLPHTQCQLEVPMIRYQSPVQNNTFPNGSGIRPHHRVLQTQADFIARRDTVLEFTRALIKRAGDCRN